MPFTPEQRTQIREASRRYDLAESSVTLLVQIIRVAVTCAALEARIIAHIKQRAPHCASARRHTLEDMVYELEAGYHRRPNKPLPPDVEEP